MKRAYGWAWGRRDWWVRALLIYLAVSLPWFFLFDGLAEWLPLIAWCSGLLGHAFGHSHGLREGIEIERQVRAEVQQRKLQRGRAAVWN